MRQTVALHAMGSHTLSCDEDCAEYFLSENFTILSAYFSSIVALRYFLIRRNNRFSIVASCRSILNRSRSRSAVVCHNPFFLASAVVKGLYGLCCSVPLERLDKPAGVLRSASRTRIIGFLQFLDKDHVSKAYVLELHKIYTIPASIVATRVFIGVASSFLNQKKDRLTVSNSSALQHSISVSGSSYCHQILSLYRSYYYKCPSK